MNAFFVDSFAFLAMVNRRDEMHARAVEAFRSSRRALVTTAWVLTELADGLCLPQGRRVFLELEARLRADPRVTIVPPSLELYERGLQLYRDRPDKDWPLTDCISFEVMRERGIVEALTGDRHFGQAGFIVLLR